MYQTCFSFVWPSPFFRFSNFGGPVHKRPVEDLAFALARFIQNGGSFINYYMVISLIIYIYTFLKEILLPQHGLLLFFLYVQTRTVSWWGKFWPHCRTIHHN